MIFDSYFLHLLIARKKSNKNKKAMKKRKREREREMSSKAVVNMSKYINGGKYFRNLGI